MVLKLGQGQPQLGSGPRPGIPLAGFADLGERSEELVRLEGRVPRDDRRSPDLRLPAHQLLHRLLGLDASFDILREFSETCRAELRELSPTARPASRLPDRSQQAAERWFA